MTTFIYDSSLAGLIVYEMHFLLRVYNYSPSTYFLY